MKMLTQKEMREARWADSVHNSTMKRAGKKGYIVHWRCGCGRCGVSHSLKDVDPTIEIRRDPPKESPFKSVDHLQNVLARMEGRNP